MTNHLDILSWCVAEARRAGADEAEALLFDSAELSVRQRMGNLESLERAESKGIGLRVFIGAKGAYKQAIISTSDLSRDTLRDAAEKAVAMARAGLPDPYVALAEPGQFAASIPDLDICDSEEPPEEKIKSWAAEAETAMLSVAGVTNSDGAEAGWEKTICALVTSKGFARSYASSSFSISAAAIAGKGDAMETDYDYTAACHSSDLKPAAAIGKNAGERAARRLHPQKIKSGRMPLLFDPRVARGLVHALTGAVNGAAVARGTSFLKDMMGRKIFREGVSIIDDPLRQRGLSSEPFDAEGIAGARRAIIENGVLTTWLLDLRSANQLGLQSTGHAARGISSPPSPAASNVHLEAGEISPEALMADITEGIYITDTFGMGVNQVTGDYSQGAAGFRIVKGKLAGPVSEITIAGNLLDMFRELIPANDLEFLHGTNAPTIRIDGMTVAGE